MSTGPKSAKSIFTAAIEKSSREEREAYLDEACAGDPQLRERVEALLRAHQEPESFLEKGAVKWEASPATMEYHPVTERPGSLIGRYKLREKIGEGGMGVVYVAEQTEPVQRKVALKIIKPGMGTREVIARFEAERQALALMDHPNIAKVLDAGATDSGRPFFVMELVRGVAITEHCDQNQLALRQRLELFVSVCQAVQHAHQKGIIHRDIKPTNVLVTLHDGVPVPKIIDFGVAKAISQRLTERTVYTKFAQMIGTPLYMSPEQAEMSGLDVDTRSDVYSLGVLLYKLLTGATPFDERRVRQAAYEELLRIIREEEPPKPSLRISTLGDTLPSVAAQRKTEPKRLSALVRGDLDWIVMKALEKDRTRRYETANGFAADVLRYLNDEPVVAGPPSALYRFRKFARRNKAALGTTALVAAALLLGTVVSTWQAFRATHFWRLADNRAESELTARLEADEAKGRAQAAFLNEKKAREDLRRNLYVANMNVAQHYWDEADLGRLCDLLDRWLPTPGEEDLRGFEWYYWWRLAHPNVVSLVGHRHAAMDVAFSPDGKTLASCSYDRTIKLWDPATGELKRSLLGHQMQIWSVAFSPDGSTLASGGFDTPGSTGELIIWDLESSRPGLTLKNPQRVYELAFSPDGATLASRDKERHVRLWDVKTGELKNTFRSHRGGVAFSPDGKTLASGSDDETIGLWDAGTGVLRKTLAAHAGVNEVVFSPDGGILAVACGDKRIRLWDPATGELMKELVGHKRSVWALDFSPDGRRLASGSPDQTVRLWDVFTGQEKATLKGHSARVRSVAFSPDARWLASSSEDDTVKLWPLDARERPGLIKEDGYGDSVAFSPDGRSLATGNGKGVLRLRDPATGRVTGTLDLRRRRVPTLRISADGRLLAVGAGAVLDLWSLEQKRLTHTFTGFAERGLVGNRAVQGIAFSPDSRTLAFITDNYDVRLCEVVSGEELATFSGQGEHITCVAFSPGGDRLGVGSSDDTVKLFEVKTGRLQATLSGHTGNVMAVAFSPDGRLLASGSSDATVKLWDLATGKPKATMGGHRNAVYAVTFAPDGKTLAAVTWEGSVSLWNTATGNLLATIAEEMYNTVKWAAFSPNGRLLAFRSKGKIRILRGATDTEVQSGRREPLDEVTRSILRGNSYAEEERFQEAIEEYTRVIELEPRQPLPRLWRGECHAALGHCEEAIADLSVAIDSGVDDPGVWVQHGELLSAVGLWKEAAQQYTLADKRSFKLGVHENYRRLLLHLLEGDLPRVREAQQTLLDRFANRHDHSVLYCVFRGLTITPASVLEADELRKLADRVDRLELGGPLWRTFLIALTHYRLGEYQEALDHLNELPSTKPCFRPVFAMVHHQLGDEGEARRYLEEADTWYEQAALDHLAGDEVELPLMEQLEWPYFVATRRDAARVVQGRDEWKDPWHHLIRGRVLLRMDEREKAEQEFQAALAAQPEDPAVLAAWSAVLTQRGEEQQAEAVFGQAIDGYSRAIERSPEDADLHFGRAEAYLSTGDHDKSLADFNEAIRLDESLGATRALYHRRAEAHAGLEQWGEAAADLARASELKPTKRSIWLERARALLAAGKTDEYHAYCKELLETHGQSEVPAVLKSIAGCYMLAPHPEDDLERAVEIAKKAAASSLTEHSKYTYCGAVLFRAGRYEEAMKHLEEEADKLGRGGSLLLFMAMAEWRLGRKDEARRLLDEGRKLMDKSLADQPPYRKIWLQMLRREAEELIKNDD